jgi:hypothetical protein
MELGDQTSGALAPVQQENLGPRVQEHNTRAHDLQQPRQFLAVGQHRPWRRRIQGRGRDGGGAPLFDSGVPGGTDAAQLRHFLAARAQKIAQQAG